MNTENIVLKLTKEDIKDKKLYIVKISGHKYILNIFLKQIYKQLIYTHIHSLKHSKFGY